jgi:hypothetical protein
MKARRRGLQLDGKSEYRRKAAQALGMHRQASVIQSNENVTDRM